MSCYRDARRGRTVFFALQFFLSCSFFCVAVFFALQLLCGLLGAFELCGNQVLSRDGGTPSLMIKEKDEDWGGLDWDGLG